MNSIILSSAARFVTPLLLVFSIFALLRGHNDPGGGFIGGLIAAAALGLCVLSDGVARVRAVLRCSPRTLLAVGLIIALCSGLIGLFAHEPFLKGLWVGIPTPLGTAKVGTPILFDIGVYLVVLGTVLTFIFTLARDDEGAEA